MKTPMIVRVVKIICVFYVLIYALRALGALSLIASRPATEVLTTSMVCSVLSFYSFWIFTGFRNRKFRSRRVISLFLWVMIITYPCINVLRSFGLYVPVQEIADNEVLGAAAVELFRYLFLLFMIVWTGFSKKLNSFFKQEGLTTTGVGNEEEATAIAQRG